MTEAGGQKPGEWRRRTTGLLAVLAPHTVHSRGHGASVMHTDVDKQVAPSKGGKKACVGGGPMDTRLSPPSLYISTEE